jgi:hypothetical protein
MQILDQKAEGLADELRRLPLEDRRLLLAKAAGFVAIRLPDLRPTTKDIVRKATENGKLSAEEISAARTLAEKADERYLTLQEKGEPKTEWGRWFSEGRLLLGIAVGFDSETWTDTADAMYEFFCSLDDPAELIAMIRSQARSLARE